MEFSPYFSLILAVIYMALHLFGWGFNALIGWAERTGRLEGHTAYAVAGGVTVTLAPFAFVGSVSIWWVYVAFVASGTPMILGAWWRHTTARKGEQDTLRSGGDDR
jgi:hypothetical protein